MWSGCLETMMLGDQGCLETREERKQEQFILRLQVLAIWHTCIKKVDSCRHALTFHLLMSASVGGWRYFITLTTRVCGTWPDQCSSSIKCYKVIDRKAISHYLHM